MKRSRAYFATVKEQPDYGVFPTDPDVYGTKKRATQRAREQRNRPAAENEDEFDRQLQQEIEDLPDEALPTDMAITAEHLIDDLMYADKKKPHPIELPPLCFLHQVYSIQRDNTAVDRELAVEIERGRWRKFYILGTMDDEYALMRTDDYIGVIRSAKDQFVRETAASINKEGKDLEPAFFDRFQALVLRSDRSESSISRQALLDIFSEKEVSQLCIYGLLIPHMKKDAYWFAIRGQGAFVSNFLKGRLEILRMLKKRPTKDILEKMLKTKRLRQSAFSHDFLLHDLIGSGRATRHKTTMGDLIKLTKKGELTK
ncbi:serine-threonine protein kinase 19-domain-containing protein [Gongronella butleri]|nr:serine-threonine protein kinase 19-domain-containing protein [Gongronella butleri]